MARIGGQDLWPGLVARTSGQDRIGLLSAVFYKDTPRPALSQRPPVAGLHSPVNCLIKMMSESPLG